jgi:glycosyltransferase involved in cell wall biosynthesis
MIRLLMAITLSEAGGSQRVVYDIIANLPESLYDVTLLTAPGGELLQWVEELNSGRTNKVKVITAASFRRRLSPRHDGAAFCRILSVLVRGRYDVAHFHNSKMGIVGRLAAKAAGVPKVYYTVHGWGLNRKTTGRLYPAVSALERAVSGLATEVVFVCKSDRDRGIQNRWAKARASRVVCNGIAGGLPGQARFREQLGISEELPLIVFVARLADPKDPMFAIRVSGRLGAYGLKHRLVLIGDGPLREGCRKLIDEQGQSCQAVLLGQRGDVRLILREADIFCLFSKWEGLPVSILEAMMAGLPVVASAVGGVPELVEHGGTGFLLDSFDVDAAASLLAGLIQDRQLRLAMGRAGRARALERFTLEGMVAGYRQLYEQPQMKAELPGRAAWSQ